jgi:hypothetical protein
MRAERQLAQVVGGTGYLVVRGSLGGRPACLTGSEWYKVLELYVQRLHRVIRRLQHPDVDMRVFCWVWHVVYTLGRHAHPTGTEQLLPVQLLTCCITTNVVKE